MTDLFNQDDGQQDLDANKNYLEELVGENKKFKDLEALARGKFESDNYIQILERRLDDMREDQLQLRQNSDSRATLEQLIEQVKQLNSTNPQADNINQQPTLKITDVEELVSTRISQHETSKIETENFRTVESKLKDRYGANYKDILKDQIRDLGLTPEYVNEMARKFPKAIIKTLGLDEAPRQNTFEGPPRSNQRTDGFSPKVQKRTWSYYQKMRKENPTLYNNPQTAKQMQRDFVELGDDFKDGDFNRFGEI